MNTLTKRTLPALVAMLALLARSAVAAPPAPLKLPDFDALAAKAAQSVNITLDSNLLGLAAGFLDSSKPEDAAAKELVAGLRGVYVRSYTFDQDFVYAAADLDAVRKQLSAPGSWGRSICRSCTDSKASSESRSCNWKRINDLKRRVGTPVVTNATRSAGRSSPQGSGVCCR
jgi:hypothetical protein